MVTKTVSSEVWVDVDVDMDEFDDDELIAELESRNYKVQDVHEYDFDITQLYEAYSLGQIEIVLQMLPEFFYKTIGRIV